MSMVRNEPLSDIVDFERASDQKAIRAPRQDRSRQTMDRVLKALEELLDEKPFDRITMIELAQRSGTGTSSIYARFKDKRSLILGVHGRLAEQVYPCLDRLFDFERLGKKPLRKIIHANLASILRFYREHGQLVRAAVIVDAPYVYERQVRVYCFAADRFSSLLYERLPATVNRKDIDRAADFSVRLVTSILHQILVFKDFSLGRKPLSDRALVDQMTVAIWATLQDAAGGRLKDE
jgi:AcrR family transcriptional regulator